MELVDGIIAVSLIAFAVAGFRQGFVVGAASLVGFVIGLVGATRLSQLVLDGGSSNPYAAIWGMACALAFAALLSAALEGVAGGVRHRIHSTGGAAVDRILGAILAGTAAVLLVWILAAVIMSAPGLRAARPYVLQSQVLLTMNEALPPAGPFLNLLSRYDPLPTLRGPRVDVAAPDLTSIRDPEVRAAARSVVRVVGTACGYSITGSGWVAAPGVVVTNAHVVAGESETAVQVEGRGEKLDARVVAFDPVNDLAVLRVRGLRRDPLRSIDGVARENSEAAILGYPENGPFDAKPARVSDERDVRADDIYRESKAIRPIVSFRGVVRHGNSGGPLVDTSGRVISTVFATTVGDSVRGGYAVPAAVVDELVEQVRAAGVSPASVNTGRCIG